MLTGMEWWDGLWEWLNTNADGVTAVAAPLSVLFTGLAGYAAVVATVRSRRRERCNLRLELVPTKTVDKETRELRTVVNVLLCSDGPATPIWVKFRRYRAEGGSGDACDGSSRAALMRHAPHEAEPQVTPG